MMARALLIALVILTGCASKPPRCDRRLVPINVSFQAATGARRGGR